MTIDSERKNGILLVSPECRLDAFEAVNLGKTLDAALKDEDIYVVLDMSGVPYLSSGGLRVLLVAQKKLSRKGGRLFLCALTEYAVQVIKMAGMDIIFTACDSVDAAFRQIAARQHIAQSEKDWQQLPGSRRLTRTPSGSF